MPINNPGAVLPWRSPRPRILIDGKHLFGVMDVSVTSTNNFHGDRFSAELVGIRLVQGVGSLAWWASRTMARVTVQVGLIPQGGEEADAKWTDLLVGVVDRVSVDPFGGVISLDGRDLTALLRDSGEGSVDVNQTASEAVAKIAVAAGLTPRVTPTTALIGRFYQLEHTAGSLAGGHRFASQWDAVVEFARMEGFDAYVSGTELHFHPPAGERTDPYLISADPRESNVTNLWMTRALHIARGVSVEVKSWHARNASTVTAEQRAPGVDPRTYTVVRPGLTQEQADALARRYLAEITRHEMTIQGTLPGDLRMTPRGVLRLTGSGTAFDQMFYPESITYRVGQRGFEMEFVARNQSPEVARTLQ